MKLVSGSGFRCLSGLEKTASTGRVLNLSALSLKQANNPGHRARPLFIDPALNSALIVKHRLRGDETGHFPVRRQIATKLIFPFERTDLSLGGRSLFVHEKSWCEKLRALCAGTADSDRDIEVLQALDEMPSLDPFLLREHLKRRGFEVSPTHFEISPIDLDRMQRFVGGEIGRLIQLAYDDAAAGSASTTRLIEALLTDSGDAGLEPLRLTLRLEGQMFQEGAFAWRGFLYYKWVLNALWPDLQSTLGEIAKVIISGPRDDELLTAIAEARVRVRTGAQRQVRIVMGLLKLYDDMFERLTGEGDVGAFRQFLLESPKLFIGLGEGCGTITHLVTFWRYRFPRNRRLEASASDLADILRDFAASFPPENPQAASVPQASATRGDIPLRENVGSDLTAIGDRRSQSDD